MKQKRSTSLVTAIMTEFAGETGLSPGSRAPRRYLWTDAFAVCNFLDLYQETGGEAFEVLARLDLTRKRRRLRITPQE